MVKRHVIKSYGFHNIKSSRNKPRGYHTAFLFTSNRYWTAIGSLINLRGNYFDFNYSKSGFEADRKANFHDWMAVYSDLNNSLNDFKLEAEKKEKSTSLLSY